METVNVIKVTRIEAERGANKNPPAGFPVGGSFCPELALS